MKVSSYVTSINWEAFKEVVQGRWKHANGDDDKLNTRLRMAFFLSPTLRKLIITSPPPYLSSPGPPLYTNKSEGDSASLSLPSRPDTVAHSIFFSTFIAHRFSLRPGNQESYLISTNRECPFLHVCSMLQALE
ncbi:hypothetical protein Nepgr_009586 [Nepenthes gracilis]|uniref:Uncharacterized protein n=1 Tax=Nepenthes gracilis TaxID=150966 RepID=A0AAD3SBJ1_NEPGR|nr:hypothetical protein Nepgr_009586 [Nepenthes gracilis]